MVVTVCFTKLDGFCLLIQKIDSMFEDIVSNLLSNYLGDYLEGLTKDDLNISLWRGDLELKNLVIIFCESLTIENQKESIGFPGSPTSSERRIR